MIETARAAFVIARRDFSAVVFSKAFIFFLLGPLFPVVIGVLAGSLGDRMDRESLRPGMAVLMPAPDGAALRAAHARLVRQLGPGALPDLRMEAGDGQDERVIAAMLARKESSVLAVLSGTLERPRLTGKAGDMRRMQGDISLLLSVARAGRALPDTALSTHIVADSSGSRQQVQKLTARAAQLVLFMLTMLLAGMVLSNMVEEKTNKIIEVLAAAVPIDAIFTGKLMAMLTVSFVGIIFWGAGGIAGYMLLAPADMALPEPAVGWPAFLALAVLYFAMAYTLLGSLFIGIGAQASTVREVQTLSMPVTMVQVVVFFFATYAASQPGSAAELAAAAFPLSSPFTMVARAAQSPELWPHGLAILWQLAWVALIIRIGARLFRRNVMKSGAARAPWWKRGHRTAGERA